MFLFSLLPPSTAEHRPASTLTRLTVPLMELAVCATSWMQSWNKTAIGKMRRQTVLNFKTIWWTIQPKSNPKNQKDGLTIQMLMYILCVFVSGTNSKDILMAFQKSSHGSAGWTKHSSKPFHHEPYLALNFILPLILWLIFTSVVTVLFATPPDGSCEGRCFVTYVAKRLGVIRKRRGDREVYASEEITSKSGENIYMLS